jgi:hypothetical protein
VQDRQHRIALVDQKQREHERVPENSVAQPGNALQRAHQQGVARSPVEPDAQRAVPAQELAQRGFSAQHPGDRFEIAYDALPG